MRKYKYLSYLIILITILSSGCVSIEKTYYDKISKSYKAVIGDFGHYTLRNADGSKVTNRNTLKTILSNSNAMGIILKRNAKDVSYNTAYWIGEEYYKGIKAMFHNDFKKALSNFNKAKKNFPKIGWISDINYLTAVCYIKLRSINKAKESLTKFLSHADRVIPNSFNKYLQRNNELHQLLKNAEKYLAELKKGKFPEISNVIFPHKLDDSQALIVDTYDGFSTMANEGKKYRDLLNLNFTKSIQHERYLLGGSFKTKLIPRMDFFINVGKRVFFSDDDNKDITLFASGVMYQLIKTKKNRFAIRISPYLVYSKNDFVTDNFGQLSCSLSASLYPITWFFVYTGVRQPFLRYSFADTDEELKAFNEGRYFAGIGLRLFSSDLNLKLLVENNKWIVTMQLNNMQLGYNLNDDEVYINLFNLMY